MGPSPLILAAPPRPLYLRVVCLQPCLRHLVQSADYCYFSGFNIPASSRLVRRAFAPHELPSLIDVIVSSQDESDTIRRLLRDDAQAFVDVIDEVRSTPRSLS